MAKLTRKQRAAHQNALDILKKDQLTEDEKWTVLENYHEGAEHAAGAIGAFFTPPGLARDFSIDAMTGRRVLDICAGIGGLAFQVFNRAQYTRDGNSPALDYVCIEQNPDYVEVGKKILPEATWICADAGDLPDLGLGYFDSVISNPPFGKVRRDWKAPRYTGADFDLALVDLVSDHAAYGAFILPQTSSGFVYSGAQMYRETKSAKYRKFESETGLTFEVGCGVDTSYYRGDWKDASPLCEICTIDFEPVQELRRPLERAAA